MNLKSLVHRELGEGLTEQELASLVGVSERTIANILIDKLPKGAAIWEKFARYFRMDAEFLRSGELACSGAAFEFSESTRHSAAGHIQKVPLLKWDQIGQMITSQDFSRAIHAEAMVETTDVAGARTFALKVRDDSMEPLFSKGEMIFVNPDLPSEPGQYVVVESEDGCPEGSLLRQLKEIGGQSILHPLNRRHDDLPLTKFPRILGRVVRLRKNL
ncbi:MAG: LexA family transcriptional regulator [Nitrospira sp.]|nr:LexA family transcriptional regulator [Nitrospira sp.]